MERLKTALKSLEDFVLGTRTFFESIEYYGRIKSTRLGENFKGQAFEIKFLGYASLISQNVLNGIAGMHAYLSYSYPNLWSNWEDARLYLAWIFGVKSFVFALSYLGRRAAKRECEAIERMNKEYDGRFFRENWSPIDEFERKLARGPDTPGEEN